MPENRNRDIRQSANFAGRVAGKTARAAGRAANALLPKEAKIAIAIVLGIFLFAGIIAGGTSSASMDATNFLTPEDSEEVNHADNLDEYTSIVSRKQSLDMTVKLASIIEKEKKKDRDKLEQELRAIYSSDNLTIECDSDTMPTYICDDVDGYGTPYDGLGGNAAGNANAAQAAVDWAIEIANDDSFNYGVKNADGGYANAPGCYFCGTNDGKIRRSGGDKRYEKTYVCMTFVTAAYAHGAKDPEVLKICQGCRSLSSSDKVFDQVSCFKKIGLMKDLSVDDLQTGDVLVHYASDDSSGHMSIYAGNGDIVDASGGGFTPGSISLKKGRAENYLKSRIGNHGGQNFVMRYIGQGGSSAGSVSSGSQQVIDGACKWAEAIAEDNRFHYGPDRTKEDAGGHAAGCYFCGTNSKIKASRIKDREYTYCCNTFCFSAYAHSGDKDMLEMCKKGRNANTSIFYDNKHFKRVENPTWSTLQRGDVVQITTNNHFELYLGNNKVAHAGSHDDNRKNSRAWNNSIRVGRPFGTIKYAYRYIGSGGGVMEMPTGAGNTGNGGVSGQYESQSSYKNLSTISSSTGRLVSIGCSGRPYKPVAQSFAYTGSGFAVAFTDGPTTGTSGTVKMYDKDAVSTGHQATADIYHANGSCITSDGNLWVAGKLNSSNNVASVITLDGRKITASGTKSLPASASAIAYDQSTNKYILSTGGAIRVFDETLSGEPKSISRNMHGAYYQDIGAGGGYVFACHTGSKGTSLSSGSNYIDIYSEEDGSYCGSYYVSYGVLESCDIVDGELVLLVHIKDGAGNYIQFTGIKVSTLAGGASPSAGAVVTAADMDILAAYSISLANSALRFDKKSDDKKTIGDLIFSKRYVDINGKPVKTYWFGEDKGKINYEKDLEAKVNDWTFYSRKKLEVTKSGNNTHITIKESPAHEICEKMFGVKPWDIYVNAYPEGYVSPFAEKDDDEKDSADDASSEKASSSESEDSSSGIDKSEWNLILVNNDNAVPDGYSPDLKTIDGSYITSGDSSDKWRNRVDSRIYDALMSMMDDCKKAGHSPLICSAYRTYDMQEELYNAAVNKSDTAVQGHSEHECGLAVDIVDKDNQVLDDNQANNETQKWLMKNCQNYGFILRYPKDKEDITEIVYEPWHYRYVGKEHAKKIMSSGVCLEEYLEGKRPDNNQKAEDEEVDAEDNEGMDSGLITNAIAIYSLSTTTSALLFTGTMERNASQQNGEAVYTGSNPNFPLPMESDWGWSSPFGQRWGRLHAGIDLSAPAGTAIHSTTDGQVILAEYNGGLGNCVIVRTGNMDYVYGHMSKIKASLGPVKKGQQIGEVGSTGNSTGNHLHYEIKVNGVAIDPYPLFDQSIKSRLDSNKTADFYY